MLTSQQSQPSLPGAMQQADQAGTTDGTEFMDPRFASVRI